MKLSVLILFLLFSLKAIYAQTGVKIYYLAATGEQVSSADRADLMIKVTPPGRGAAKLYFVNGYDAAGRFKFSATSLNNTLPLLWQGTYTDFFAPGRKKELRRFENGVQTGDDISFYPNGNFYCLKTVINEANSKNTMLYEDCRDSTGKILAAGGNGDWAIYNDTFDYVISQGKISNGHIVGNWATQSSHNPYVKRGQEAISSAQGGKDSIFKSAEVQPEFPGGANAFHSFIYMHLQYPNEARQNGAQGTVVVSFVVEKDGSITDVAVARGIGSGCDEEAVRVVKLSPKWTPGIQNKHPVRTVCTVPVSFSAPEN
jgi:TonB family protein